MVREEVVAKNKMLLRPLIGLMHGKVAAEIERHTIEELAKHRRLRDEAVRLEAQMEQSDSEKDRVPEVERAYVSAMIAVHAQQTVVSTLLDILGYIPETPKGTPH